MIVITGITRSQLEKLHDPSTGSFAILSPYKSRDPNKPPEEDTGLPKSENKRRYTELIQFLNEQGYRWESTQGTWSVDNEKTGKVYFLENSVLIHNIDFGSAEIIGEHYEQEAIIYKSDEGRVFLYDLGSKESVEMTSWEADMQAPRRKVKEEKGIEQKPSTRWRDVELTYNFDFDNPMEIPARRFLFNAIRILAGKPIGVKLAPQIYDNWTTDAEFILDNVGKFDGKPVGRFAYNPKTKELVWGDMYHMHALLVMNQATSPFEEFVRGVYDGNKVMLRWYGTDPYKSKDEIQAESFEAWWSTKKMLEQNGLPPGTEVELGVSNVDLAEAIPGYR